MSATLRPPERQRGSATSYEAAEHAVDWLSDQGFPVEHVRIVGTGLRYVEQVDDGFADEAERLVARNALALTVTQLTQKKETSCSSPPVPLPPLVKS